MWPASMRWKALARSSLLRMGSRRHSTTRRPRRWSHSGSDSRRTPRCTPPPPRREARCRRRWGMLAWGTATWCVDRRTGSQTTTSRCRETDHAFYHLPVTRSSQRQANVDYYRRNRALEIGRVRSRQHGTVELLRDLRSRPCLDCGGVFAPYQMDFDHRDASAKRFRLTEGGAMLRPMRVILDEVAKCDIVCANCHRVRTQRRHATRAIVLEGRSRGLERKRASWREQARLLDQLRDRPCADCGLRYAPAAMDFDHRDSSTKRAGVTRMIGRAGTKRILEEATKCDIVCANCHRLRTFRRRSAGSVRE